MRMNWFSSLMLSVGVPVVFAGVAFVAAGRNGAKSESSAESNNEPIPLLPKPTEEQVKSVKKSKNKNKNKSKNNKNNKPQQPQPQSSESDESSGSDYVESTAEEDIIRLAANHRNIGKVQGVVKRTPDSPITLVPISVNVNNDGKQDDQEWSRVPTKTEEMINNLKQRIEQLSRQLQEQDEQRSKDHHDQEQQQRRFKEAEHDWRERVKALVQQVSNLENELTGLRANNQYLSEQCANVEELERRNDQLMSVQERNSVLEQQLMHMEKLFRDAQSAKEAAINTSAAVRAGLEADLEQVRREYLASRQVADSLRRELAEAVASRVCADAACKQYFDLAGQTKSEMATIRSNLDQVVIERDNYKSKVEEINGQLCKCKMEMEAIAANNAHCNTAMSVNNQYVSLLVEADQKSYQEKSRLVQELVAVRRQLQALVKN